MFEVRLGRETATRLVALVDTSGNVLGVELFLLPSLQIKTLVVGSSTAMSFIVVRANVLLDEAV